MQRPLLVFVHGNLEVLRLVIREAHSAPVDFAGVLLHWDEGEVAECAAGVVGAGLLQLVLPSGGAAGVRRGGHGDLAVKDAEPHDDIFMLLGADDEVLAGPGIVGPADRHRALLGLRGGRMDNLVILPVALKVELLPAEFADGEARLEDALGSVHADHLLHAPLRPGARDEVGVAVGAAKDVLVLRRSVVKQLPGDGSPLAPGQRDPVDLAGGHLVLAAVDAPVPALAVLLAAHDDAAAHARPLRAREELLPVVCKEVEVLVAAGTHDNLARVTALAIGLHLVHSGPA
mmetsp:Transcript_130988/g.407367  ORF Transcript_130988/g.407367 Transcript_130988/m.407367 type:complete len:288 (-) Transcript_130988:2658-3521(-)